MTAYSTARTCRRVGTFSGWHHWSNVRTGLWCRRRTPWSKSARSLICTRKPSACPGSSARAHNTWYQTSYSCRAWAQCTPAPGPFFPALTSCRYPLWSYPCRKLSKSRCPCSYPRPAWWSNCRCSKSPWAVPGSSSWSRRWRAPSRTGPVCFWHSISSDC